MGVSEEVRKRFFEENGYHLGSDEAHEIQYQATRKASGIDEIDLGLNILSKSVARPVYVPKRR